MTGGLVLCTGAVYGSDLRSLHYTHFTSLNFIDYISMVSICVFVFSSNHMCSLENPMDRGAWRAYSPWGHKRVEHNIVTKQQQQPTVIVYTYTYMCTYIHTYIYVHIHIHLGYSPWGCKRIRNDLVSKQQLAIFVCVCVWCVYMYTHIHIVVLHCLLFSTKEFSSLICPCF